MQYTRWVQSCNQRPINEYATGTTIRVSSVELTTPPITATASGPPNNFITFIFNII